MPFLAQTHVDIPKQDLLSWMFDNPQYDIDMPIYIDAANPSRSISCRQAKSLIRRLAAGFREAGVQKGDCVCLHSFNDIYYSMAFLGIVAAGGVFAGTNPAYTHYELEHAIETAKIKFFLAEPEILEPVVTAAMNSGIPIENVFVFDIFGRGMPEIKDELMVQTLRSWSWLQGHGEAEWERFNGRKMSETTSAARLFSSGTTGLPKALDMTHYNFVSNSVASGASRSRLTSSRSPSTQSSWSTSPGHMSFED
jgi:4-coumarate--CoA ligase